MLRINENKMINAKEIYSFVEVKTQFNKWIDRCIEYADLQKGTDFWTVLGKSTGGRPALEYFFTINAAKEICIVSATAKAKELRRWLIGLSNEVETGLRLSHEQVMEIIRMIKIFSVYEFRKQALEKNKENYVQNATILNKKGNLYAQFNIWRNEALNLGREVLEQRVKEYCLIEHRALPTKKLNTDTLLTMMGDYEQIKNAVWDLLSSQNKSEELIKNICKFAHDLAKEMKPFLERLNESNLFFYKIDFNETKKIGL